jgi:hypothetical protein
VNAAAWDAGLSGLDSWEAVDAYRDLLLAAEQGTGEAADRAVALLGLESVISRWIDRRAMVSIHHALVAGAGADQVAAVAGIGVCEVAARWRAWAHGQRLLAARCPGLGLSEAGYRRVAAALEAVTGGGDMPVRAG